MICAVVLAAGRSVRMGQQKLLLPIGGKPMIARIVNEVLRSPVNSTTVVLGPDAHAVRDALDAGESSSDAERRRSNQLSFVTNPDPSGDMLSSVRCGLRALPKECEAVVIVLGDQPGVTARLIQHLIDAFQSSQLPIAVPVRDHRRGHPIVFSARFREEVLASYDGVGLHGLLEAHASGVIEVNSPADADLDDLDTPEEYRQYLHTHVRQVS